VSKLSTPAKLGVLVGALLILLVAGWFVAIAPKRSEATKLAGQIDDTRAQIVVAQRLSSQPPTQTPTIRVADLFQLSRAMPSRAENHSMAAADGCDFPSSTWLTYSLLKRVPARSVWVRPAETRSWRTRSPRRGACGALEVWVRAALDISGFTESTSFPTKVQDGAHWNHPKGAWLREKAVKQPIYRNHLTELLDKLHGPA